MSSNSMSHYLGVDWPLLTLDSIPPTCVSLHRANESLGYDIMFRQTFIVAMCIATISTLDEHRHADDEQTLIKKAYRALNVLTTSMNPWEIYREHATKHVLMKGPWWSPRVQRCFCPSEESAQRLTTHNLEYALGARFRCSGRSHSAPPPLFATLSRKKKRSARNHENAEYSVFYRNKYQSSPVHSTSSSKLAVLLETFLF